MPKGHARLPKKRSLLKKRPKLGGTSRAPPLLPRKPLFSQANTSTSQWGWRPLNPWKTSIAFDSFSLWSIGIQGSRGGSYSCQNRGIPLSYSHCISQLPPFDVASMFQAQILQNVQTFTPFDVSALAIHSLSTLALSVLYSICSKNDFIGHRVLLGFPLDFCDQSFVGASFWPSGTQGVVGTSLTMQCDLSVPLQYNLHRTLFIGQTFIWP